MSGYIFNLGSRKKLELYAMSGAYGTIIRRPDRDFWSVAHEKTLADYLTVRPGSLVFFFYKRRVYGVGRIVGFDLGDETVAALANYPGASFPHANPPEDPEVFLWRENGEENLRWVIFFDPYPHFFQDGLDMDEILTSDLKSVVRSLRVFFGVSFVQMESDEAQLILDLLLRSNQDVLAEGLPPDGVFLSRASQIHDAVRHHDLNQYRIDLAGLIAKYSDEDGSVRHEALVHGWLADSIARQRSQAVQVFGAWDYVANEYPASPQKPVVYMDRIDIFGYVQEALVPGAIPTILRYKAIEIKKGRVTSPDVVKQLLKYVDWVAHTRAGGDYSLVDAYFVAHGYSDEVVEYVEKELPKDFITPRRPYDPAQWARLKLVEYKYSTEREDLELTLRFP